MNRAEELRSDEGDAAQAEYDFQQQAQLWDLIAKVTLFVSPLGGLLLAALMLAWVHVGLGKYNSQ